VGDGGSCAAWYRAEGWCPLRLEGARRPHLCPSAGGSDV